MLDLTGLAEAVALNFKKTGRHYVGTHVTVLPSPLYPKRCCGVGFVKMSSNGNVTLIELSHLGNSKKEPLG